MSSDDFMDRAAKESAEGGGEQYPTWKWKEEGHVLAGTLLSAKVQGTKDGRINYLLAIDELGTDDIWALWVGDSPVVLKNQMQEQAPAIGEMVYIEYKGKVDGKDGGYSYGLYFVKADVPDRELWTKLEHEKGLKAAGEGSYGGSNTGSVPASSFGPDESPF